MIYLELITNLSFLVAISIVSGFIEKRWPVKKPVGSALQGVLFGAAAVLGMLNPFVLTPGLIFDGRSVMISLCALFFGPWAAAIAGTMAILCRLAIGGIGTITGLLVISSSAVLGIIYHFRLRPAENPPQISQLYLFGLAVHALMLAMMFSLPGGKGLETIMRIGLPVMLSYPLATILIGKILSDQVTAARQLEALRISEERHRQEHERLEMILKTAQDGFWQVDMNGRLLMVNDTYSRMSGYSVPELLAMSISDLEAVEAPEDTENRMRRLVTPGEDRFESRHRRKDGTIFDVEVSTQYRPDGGGQIVVFLRDITDRKQAEERLAESGRRWRNVLVNTPQIGISLDPEAAIIFANTHFLNLTGWKEEEVLGKNWFDLFIPADIREEIRHVFATTMHSRDTLGFSAYENEILTRSGERLTIAWSNVLTKDAEGAILDVTSLGIDLTERKRTEERLKKSETRFREMADMLPQAIFEADARGMVTYANRYAFELFGYPVEDLEKGLNITQMLTPEDSERSLSDILDIIAVKQQITGREYHARRKDGSFFPVEVYASTIISEGAVTGLRGIVIDMTQKKKEGEERKQLQAQLSQAQKMESVGRLAGGVAHDFNNMLGVIIGHTEMAMTKLEPDQPLYNHIQSIQKAAEKSADLTRQLLAFARKQTIEPRVIDLNETVEGHLKMLRRLIGEDIDLGWHPASKLPPVKVDPSQLDQVLTNLCVNARDAIAGVGKITIETDSVILDEAYCAANTGFIPGDYVRLTVSDNGCGMERDVLDKIFEPFFTTKELGKGTGLGLSTVYGIVRQHDGFIKIYSEPGHGTTFNIYLPCYQGMIEDDQTRESAPAQAPHGIETILLVEDEPAMRNVIEQMLKKQGYRVLAATTPAEAMALAEQFDGQIDLLMTDVIMPEMNGRELAQNLLFDHPDIECLFMSGYTADVIARHGVLEEGLHFIQKPFNLMNMALKVREILDKK